MEMWLAKSLVERNLGNLPNYRNLTQVATPLVGMPPGIRIRDGEQLVGMYTIPDDLLQPPIVITDVGVHVGFETTWRVIEYENMSEVHGPTTKDEISGVTIHLRNGHHVEIPVRGARRQLRDAFSFLQYLMGVLKVESGKKGRRK
jgi:hypothetical protein